MISQAYQWRETARITKAAKRSTAATIGNNRRPYHWTRRNLHPRYVLQYLHLALNSRQQLAPESRQQLRPGSSMHKYGRAVRVGNRSRIAPIGVGSHALRLASLELGRIALGSVQNWRGTSKPLLRPPQVRES